MTKIVYLPNAVYKISIIYVSCLQGDKKKSTKCSMLFIWYNMNQNRRPKTAYICSHRSDVRPISICFKPSLDIRNIWKCSAVTVHDTYWLGTVHWLLAIFLLLIRLVEGLILIFSPDYYTIVQSIRMQNSQTVAWPFSSQTNQWCVL